MQDSEIQNLSEDDKNKLEKMYFYMQDIMIEMVSCSTLIQMLYDFHNGREYAFYTEYEKVILTVPKSIDRNIFMTNVRVPFHLLVVNVFKLGELINQNQRFLKDYLGDEIKSKLDSFKKKYFTSDVVIYRNKYVAHHRNNETKDFLSYEELTDLLGRILGVSDSRNINWSSFLKYSQNFYTQVESKKAETICQIIYELHPEIEKHLGRKLDRKKAK
jgi:hypothetical protein